MAKISAQQLSDARSGRTSTPNTTTPSVAPNVAVGSGSTDDQISAIVQGVAQGANTGASTGPFSTNFQLNARKWFAPLALGQKQKATTTAVDQLNELYHMGASEIVQLQERLLRAGFYGSGATRKDVVTGVADPMTQQAYADAITSAGQYFAAGNDDTDLDTMIDDFATSRDKNGLNINVDSKVQPTIQLDNPDDLMNTLSSVSQQLMGRKVTAEELGNTFVEHYHQQQINAANQDWGFSQAQEGGQGGQTEVGLPSAQTAAEAAVRDKYGAEVGAHDIANVGQNFFQLLNGVGG